MTEFELIATRPGEVLTETLPTLSAALTIARDLAFQGFCVLIKEHGSDADGFECVVTVSEDAA
jgi:hypothetical protein